MKPTCTDLNPVSDSLIVGFVLKEPVQMFAKLLSTEDFFTGFLWRHLLSYGVLHFLKCNSHFKDLKIYIMIYIFTH